MVNCIKLLVQSMSEKLIYIILELGKLCLITLFAQPN